MPKFDFAPHAEYLGYCQVWLVKSMTTEDQTYVLVKSEERTICSCPGFTYRGECKHIGALDLMQTEGR